MQADWSDALEAFGNVVPWQESIIGAEIGGLRIHKVLVNTGDTVRRGQVLARLNRAGVEVDLELVRAQVSEAEATLAQAEATLERSQRLAADGGVSRQDLLQQQTQQRVARARLQAVRAQLAAQQLRLGYTTLVAPDDGLVSSRTATEGAVVQAGTELFRLIRGARLEWRAEVKGEALLGLKPGMKVALRHPDGSRIEGTLRQVSASVDTASRNGIAYVDLPASARLKAGLYLGGRFELGERTALTVPRTAVVARDGRNLVFTVDDAGKVRALEVTTGRSRDNRVEVLSGLEPHTPVVTTGAAFLKPGDAVRVSPAATSGARPVTPAGK